MTHNPHALLIRSVDDAQAECTCGTWEYYHRTGNSPATYSLIAGAFEQHLHDYAQPPQHEPRTPDAALPAIHRCDCEHAKHTTHRPGGCSTLDPNTKKYSFYGLGAWLCSACYQFSIASGSKEDAPEQVYNVHLYPVVRVKVSGISARSQREAIFKAEDAVDLYALFARLADRELETEYAEEISAYLVDEDADQEHEHSQWYDANVKPDNGMLARNDAKEPRYSRNPTQRSNDPSEREALTEALAVLEAISRQWDAKDLPADFFTTPHALQDVIATCRYALDSERNPRATAEHVAISDVGDFQYCLCGNTPIDNGFYPCDPSGNQVEASSKGWPGLWLCDLCKRIINASGQVVGREAKDTRLDAVDATPKPHSHATRAEERICEAQAEDAIFNRSPRATASAALEASQIESYFKCANCDHSKEEHQNNAGDCIKCDCPSFALDSAHNTSSQAIHAAIREGVAKEHDLPSPTIGRDDLPPDPDGMNEERREWADAALETFMQQTGVDKEDAVCDLLADLMHWCDGQGIDFNNELARARDHYAAETSPEDDGERARR